MRKLVLIIGMLSAIIDPAHAQSSGNEAAISAPPVPETPVIDPKTIVIPAFTFIELAILTPLNSKTSNIGEMFDILLSEPIIVDGITIVPTGAKGQGEVIHAAKARAAGKAGEMILAARYIEHNGQKIVLRSFKYGPSTGKSNRDEALIAGAIIAAPLTLLITGKNVDIPAGTLAHAKTSIDNTITLEGIE